MQTEESKLTQTFFGKRSSTRFTLPCSCLAIVALNWSRKLRGLALRKWPARLQWKPKTFAQIPKYYRLFKETDAHGTGGVFL